MKERLECSILTRILTLLEGKTCRVLNHFLEGFIEGPYYYYK